MEKHLCAAQYRAVCQDFQRTMAPCCWEPPAFLAETGKDPFGSTANQSKPPARASAKPVCRLRLGSQMSSALELWELAEDERLLVNRFTKYEHDHIVTTVSPITGASSAVTGSMDCRLDSITHINE
ncbi:hypothetical protein XENOCAPTIV_003948 [Xenoophorus captivus]|uniref:Uncharacterized protein n=1 Tax=Xenoophorus captivus TaxID=1517983 RepID=A0ABV0QPS9_9TELE